MYRIKQRAKQYAVVEVETGKDCRLYPSRSAAVAAIEALGRKPAQRQTERRTLSERMRATEQRLQALSRSSKYRLAKGDPWLQMLLVPEAGAKWRRLEERMKKSARATMEWLERKPPNVGVSEWLALRDDAEYMRRHRAQLATKAKQRKANTRSEKARALAAAGEKQKNIAARIGIRTAHGVRKLLKRRK